MSQKKRLVILGGGLAGLPLARQIEKNKKLSASIDVTLVDKKHYFELTLASPRFLVDPDQHAKVILLSFISLFVSLGFHVLFLYLLISYLPSTYSSSLYLDFVIAHLLPSLYFITGEFCVLPHRFFN